MAMSPPNGEGRPPDAIQGSGPIAQSAITTPRVTDQALAALYVLVSTSYRYGRLAGFADGWRNGLEAGIERRPT